MSFSALHTQSKALISSSSPQCVCVCWLYKPATKTAVARATFYGSGAERERSARASITRRNGPSIVPPPSPLSLTCRKNPSSRQSDHHDLFHKRLGMICNIYIPSLSVCLLTAFPHIVENINISTDIALQLIIQIKNKNSRFLLNGLLSFKYFASTVSSNNSRKI
jgi:hypothetical protein